MANSNTKQGAPPRKKYQGRLPAKNSSLGPTHKIPLCISMSFFKRKDGKTYGCFLRSFFIFDQCFFFFPLSPIPRFLGSIDIGDMVTENQWLLLDFPMIKVKFHDSGKLFLDFVILMKAWYREKRKHCFRPTKSVLLKPEVISLTHEKENFEGICMKNVNWKVDTKMGKCLKEWCRTILRKPDSIISCGNPTQYNPKKTKEPTKNMIYLELANAFFFPRRILWENFFPAFFFPRNAFFFPRKKQKENFPAVFLQFSWLFFPQFSRSFPTVFPQFSRRDLRENCGKIAGKLRENCGKNSQENCRKTAGKFSFCFLRFPFCFFCFAFCFLLF